MTAVEDASSANCFATCRERLEAILDWLRTTEATAASHGEVEGRLAADGRELLRLAYQGHLDTRAEQEGRLAEVVDAEGVPRPSAEAGHERPLTTVFGEVRARRIAYRGRGHANLHPADGVLNRGCPERRRT